ncbi:MAG TPA: pyridoxal-dependent decarboxylase [Gemmatimonas sp.]|nr:pyridoxal-dependent decarboxylase [Gemmatimonas sp.]
MLDDMLAAQRGLPDARAWTEMPDETRAAMSEPVPYEGIGAEAAYQAFLSHVLPYPNGSWHPRFFGWVQGNGTPLAMLADMLSSGLNAHLGGFNQAPAVVERQTVSWLADMLGMPGATGLFVTGGTMANTLGLAVGRFAAARALGRDARRDGVQQWPGEDSPAPMVLYGSEETHGWARKAVELLGLGDRAFRRVPVDAEHRIDVDALERMIVDDRAAGLQPFCIIGTAGTVNIGATDDLASLAALAKRERLWFHVDGAFGALAYLSEALRPRVAGMELADSIGFDLHKWGSMPFDCACVLVRDAEAHHATFRTTASYLTPLSRGVSAIDDTGGMAYFAERGIDLTRSFKALKVWMSLKADGVHKLAGIIEQNVAQCTYLAALVDAHPELERLAPVPLNIVNLRYVADGLDEAALNALNQEVLLRLQERGIAVPSSTVLGGRFAIRVANVNHRSKTADFDFVLAKVVEFGREVLAERT